MQLIGKSPLMYLRSWGTYKIGCIEVFKVGSTENTHANHSRQDLLGTKREYQHSDQDSQ